VHVFAKRSGLSELPCRQMVCAPRSSGSTNMNMQQWQALQRHTAGISHLTSFIALMAAVASCIAHAISSSCGPCPQTTSSLRPPLDAQERLGRFAGLQHFCLAVVLQDGQQLQTFRSQLRRLESDWVVNRMSIQAGVTLVMVARYNPACGSLARNTVDAHNSSTQLSTPCQVWYLLVSGLLINKAGPSPSTADMQYIPTYNICNHAELLANAEAHASLIWEMAHPAVNALSSHAYSAASRSCNIKTRRFKKLPHNTCTPVLFQMIQLHCPQSAAPSLLVGATTLAL